MAKTAVQGWHFLPEDKRLRWGTREVVKVGRIVRVKCKPILCEQGLHMSVKASDALQYAPGPIICRVELRGEILEGGDKMVGTERKCLAMADATETLHRFACWCAERALKTANVTDERFWNAIRVKLNWLKGEATDAELDAAESAAESAARSAAESAAWSAARSAAESAAWSAARSAAWSAARSAAWSAARSAAWSAAWSAARSAAESAAKAAQNNKLDTMLTDLFAKKTKARK